MVTFQKQKREGKEKQQNKKKYTNQVVNNLQHALFGCFHTFFGSFESDLFALRTCAREANHHTAVFICKVPKDLATASHEVAMVLWINAHIILNNVVL